MSESISEICKRTHIQDCYFCDDLECCDNTNYILKAKVLREENEKLKDENKRIKDICRVFEKHCPCTSGPVSLEDLPQLLDMYLELGKKNDKINRDTIEELQRIILTKDGQKAKISEDRERLRVENKKQKKLLSCVSCRSAGYENGVKMCYDSSCKRYQQPCLLIVAKKG